MSVLDADGNEIDLKQNFDDDYGFAAAESGRHFSRVNDAEGAEGFSLEDENGDPITAEPDDDELTDDEYTAEYAGGDSDDDFLDDEYTMGDMGDDYDE